MMQNIRIQFARFFKHRSLIAPLSLVFGILLLLAHALAVDSAPSSLTVSGIRLALALVYLLVGGLGMLAERFYPREELPWLLFLGVAVATGIGLASLPAEGVWSLWGVMIAFSLIVTSLGLNHAQVNERIRLLAAAVVVLGAVIGLLSAESLAGYADLAAAGLGTLLIGQALLLLIIQPAASVSQDEQEQTANRFEEARAMGVHILGSDDLIDLSTRIHFTVDGLVKAAQAINEVTGMQTANADDQMEFIKKTNIRMDDFLKLSERITDHARDITRTVHQSTELTQEGKDVLQQTMEGIEQIRLQVQAIGSNIQMLARLTQRIDDIITSVSEIATQSNLLALNASIEAARAGSMGRGFAVVADEVRSLSQQSTSAAQQVREILGEIRNAMRQTVSATEIGVQSAEEGVEKARLADSTIEQISSNVATTNEAIHSIYEAIREQSEGLEEVAISVERIERITNQYLSSIRMVTTVSTNLNRLAEDLQEALQSGSQPADAVVN